MIIAVSGLAGCGKSSVGEAVARKLSLRAVQASFKDGARDAGVSLMEFQAMAGTGPELDRTLDEKIVADASAGDCVVMTWLGPWMVKGANLRVWLNAPEEERARRVAMRDNMAESEALAHVRKRDSDNIARYKRYYGIDICDHSIFDLEINTVRFSPEESADIIAAAARAAVPGKGGREG
jgi:cytidylate kinase